MLDTERRPAVPRAQGLWLAPATTTTVPTAAPHLLYAGDVADRTMVLLYDATRLARYSESCSSAHAAELG